ncbi:MAG: phosphate/phosphite/phosphonate ABC transporter substrate-binding protein [Gammaproteobacteria bacterium]|nr:phosphate/phosphite/phosphonate ABC transporter substrate-binding protein [Gammaproteobacteria bacterium]
MIGKKSVVISVVLYFCIVTPLPALSQKSYSFAIVPQSSATEMVRVWTPFIRYLSKKTGEKFVFKTASTISAFEKRVGKQQYDFAYMNPYHYIIAEKEANYVAIAKQKDKKLEGILVVSDKSDIRDISQLSGKTIAYPSPAAFAATILPQAILLQKGQKNHSKYVLSHESVYSTVSKGLYPVGGGIMRTFNALPAETKNSLRILWKSEGYTPHAFAVHSRVPSDVQEKVVNVLVAMHANEEGLRILKNLKMKNLEKASGIMWNDVRSLSITTKTEITN